MHQYQSHRFKNTIFEAHFKYFFQASLLWPRAVSKFLQYFFLWASNFQSIIILLWGQYELITTNNNDTFSYALKQISRLFSLYNFCSLANSDIYKFIGMVIVWAYFMIIICLNLFILAKFLKRSELSRAQSYFVFILAQFQLSIAFFCINIILISSISNLREDYYPENIAIKVINLILIILNYIMTISMAIFSYDPFKASNLLSSHSTVLQVLDYLFKGSIAPIIAVRLISTPYIWFFSVFTFIISLVKFYWIMNSFPYYHYIPLEITSISTLTAVLISGLTILTLSFAKFKPISGMILSYIEALILPFLVKFSQNYLQKIMRRNLMKGDASLYSEKDVIKKIFAVDHYRQKLSFNLDEFRSYTHQGLYFFGALKNLALKGETSLVSQYQADGIKFDVKEIKKVFNYSIYQSLNEVIKRSGCNGKVRFILSEHMYEKEMRIAIAITYLLEISKLKGPMQLAAVKLLQNFEQRIQKRFEDNTEIMKINPKIFVDFDIISRKFVEMILENTCQFISFWEAYKSQKFQIRDLLKRSHTIEIIDDKVREYWSKNVEIHSLSSACLKNLYKIYLRLVRNAPFSAKKIREKIHNQLVENINSPSLDNMALLDNITLTISMSKGKIGKILKISNNITRQMGWNHQDLIGKDINLLLMSFMREKHHQMLTRHLNKMEEGSDFYVNSNSFMRAKDGCILSCEIDACIHPYIQEELMYIGMIKLKNLENELIVLDDQGFVEGFTKFIGSKLAIPKDKRINITDFCTWIEELEQCSLKGFFSSRYDEPKSAAMTPHSAEISHRKIGELYKRKLFKVASRNSNKNPPKYFLLSLCCLEPQKQQVENFSHTFRANITRNTFSKTIFYILTLENTQSYNEGREQNSERKFSFDDEEAIRIFKNTKTKIETKVMEEDEANISAIVPDEDITIAHYMRHRWDSKLDLPLTERRNLLQSTSRTEQKELLILTTKFENTQQNELKLDRSLVKSTKTTPAQNNTIKECEKKILTANTASFKSSASNSKAEIEQIVYMIPNNQSIKVFSIKLLILICLSLILLQIFETKNSDSLNVVKEFIQMVSASTLQLFTFVECNRLMRHYTYFDAQIFRIDRYSYAGIPDLRFISRNRLTLVAEDISFQSKILQNSLHLVDQSLYKDLYSKIPVITWDPITDKSSVRLANSFDVITSLLASIKSIIGRPYQIIHGNDSDVLFIANNTLKDLLGATENLSRIIIESNQKELLHLSSFFGYSTLFILAYCVSTFGFLIMLEKKFINDRENFLDIFLRLNSQEIDKRLRKLEAFRLVLEKHNLDDKQLDFLIRTETLSDNEGVYQPYKKKIARREKINFDIIKVFIYTSAMILLILLIYGLVNLIVYKQKDTIDTKVNMLVDSNTNLYELAKLFFSTYEYVVTNGTSTLNGRPIKDEWDMMFNRLTDLQAKFTKVTDSDGGLGGTPELIEITKGDLCKVLPSSPYAGAQCPRLVYGIVTKGIIRLGSFMISLTERIKQSFDNSAKTREDIVKILNDVDLIQSESIWGLYMFPGFAKIGQLIREQLEKDFIASKNLIATGIYIFIFLYVISASILWWKIKNVLEGERIRWRKLIRLIPISVISNNKMLNNYLFKHRSDGFTFIKAYFKKR